MLQRSGFPTPITPEITPELSPTLARTVRNGWKRLALPLAWLPETWPQYLVLLAVVLCLAAGLAVQIYLTVEIAEAHVELQALQSEYERIERHNADLLYVIASKTALNRIHAEAQQQGFVPATGRVYFRRDLLAQSSTAAQGVAAPVAGLVVAGRSSNLESGDAAGITPAAADGGTVGWQEQLSALMRGVSENFDDWRRSVESSTRVTAGQWLDRIMGW